MALAPLSAGACRTGTVPLGVELIEGHGAGGEREPGRDARMPPGSRTGLREADASPGIIEQAGVPGWRPDASRPEANGAADTPASR